LADPGPESVKIIRRTEWDGKSRVDEVIAGRVKIELSKRAEVGFQVILKIILPRKISYSINRGLFLIDNRDGISPLQHRQGIITRPASQFQG